MQMNPNEYLREPPSLNGETVTLTRSCEFSTASSFAHFVDNNTLVISSVFCSNLVDEQGVMVFFNDELPSWVLAQAFAILKKIDITSVMLKIPHEISRQARQ